MKNRNQNKDLKQQNYKMSISFVSNKKNPTRKIQQRKFNKQISTKNDKGQQKYDYKFKQFYAF